MKKLLLYLVVFTMTIVVNAQTLKKIELADNQQLLGYYLSDKLNNKGYGLPEWGENAHCRAAINLTADMLKPYVGKKIISIRFGLCFKQESSRIFITPVVKGYEGDDAVSQPVEDTSVGWNNITLNNPYTIEGDKNILVGFDFAQKTKKKGAYYAADCYPLSIVNEGITTLPVLVYGNSGNGDCWHEMGTQVGNLSIQVVIEGNIEKSSVTAYDFSTVAGEINKSSTAKVKIANNGKDVVNSLNYTVSVDGNSGMENEVVLSSPLASGETALFNAQIPAVDTYGRKALEIEITKVNGSENTADDRIAHGYLGVPQNVYPRNVVIEEFTTEGCGNCPRVAGYLKQALKGLDKKRVFAVSHHSAYGVDWLTQPCDEEMYGLMFNGKGNAFAPAMMFNRDDDAVPVEDATKRGLVFLPMIYAQISGYTNNLLNKTANSELQMEIIPNENRTKVAVKVKGICNEAYDVDNGLLTIYMLEDSVKAKEQNGAGSGDYYHMHVIRYYNNTWGDKVVWNDDNSFEMNYDIDIFPEWKTKHLQLVAFLNTHNDSDYADNKIDNSVGVTYAEATSGINGVLVNDGTIEMERYTTEGIKVSAPVKGLNIVKMSDGRIIKIMNR